MFILESNITCYFILFRVYTFLDILGEVGGLKASLFTIGAVMVAIFAKRLFYSQLISKIYFLYFY
jgi:hypothetical protein